MTIIAKQCAFWDCAEPIRSNHFLCYDHFLDWEDGLIDECPRCKRYKDSRYELCLDCKQSRPLATPRNQKQPEPRYEPEHSRAWEKGDRGVNEFYVYILKIGRGDYYAGQTRDLRARVEEHRDGDVPTTRNKSPRLQWFEQVPTREAATELEAKLKETIDHRERDIRKMIIQFRDVVEKLDFT